MYHRQLRSNSIEIYAQESTETFKSLERMYSNKTVKMFERIMNARSRNASPISPDLLYVENENDDSVPRTRRGLLSSSSFVRHPVRDILVETTIAESGHMTASDRFFKDRIHIHSNHGHYLRCAMPRRLSRGNYDVIDDAIFTIDL